MAPLRNPCLLAGLFLILGAPSRAVPLDDGSGFEKQVNSEQGARPTTPAGRPPDDGDTPACLEFGQYPATVPDFDTLDSNKTCDFDPLADPVQFQKSWRTLQDAIKAKFKKQGGVPVRILVPSSDGDRIGYDETVNSGASLSEASPEKAWGEEETLSLMEDMDSTRAATFTVFHVYWYVKGTTPRLSGTLFEFDVDSNGTLSLVQTRDGSVPDGGQYIPWSPLVSGGSGDSISPRYVRNWHQLVDVLSRGL